MINLTLYGKPTSTFAFIKSMVISKAKGAGIEINMKEEMDVNTLIERNIVSIPAYEIQDQIIEQGSRDVDEFIKELQLSILRIENYGKMKKIIIPVDFSDNSANAVLYAINLFKNDNAIIKLIHTIHPNPIQDIDGKLMTELVEFNSNQMKKFINHLESQLDHTNRSVLIDSEIVLGFTCDVVKDQLDSLNGDIVLLSSSGESDTLKKLFGSVSQDLLKNCDAPTVFIPPKINYVGINKIAVAFEKAYLCDQSKEVLLDMSKRLDAGLEFIHIKNNEDVFFTEEFTSSLQSIFGSENIRFTEFQSDDPFEALNEFCYSHNIQLLTLLRRERSFFAELFHSSFTNKAAFQTKLPLLLINQS